MIEITRDQKVAWEFFNADRSPEAHDRVAVTCSAVRYRADDLKFLTAEGKKGSIASR